MMAAISVSVRAATAADLAGMENLYTTKVAATSPLDEVIAIYGSAFHWTAAALQRVAQQIAADQALAIVAIDGTNTLRGWNLYWHHDGLTSKGVLDVDDAWESALTVTDKSLVIADRLAIAGHFIHAVAARTGAFIWGDVAPIGGNFDTFLSTKFPFVVATTPTGVACHRYYADSATIAAVL